MEVGIENLEQGFVFLFTFTSMLVIVSALDNRTLERLVLHGLRKLMDLIPCRVAMPDGNPSHQNCLSDETWQRVMQIHMINAAPDRRM